MAGPLGQGEPVRRHWCELTASGFLASLLELSRLGWAVPDVSPRRGGRARPDSGASGAAKARRTMDVTIPHLGSKWPLHLPVPSRALLRNTLPGSGRHRHQGRRRRRAAQPQARGRETPGLAQEPPWHRRGNAGNPGCRSHFRQCRRCRAVQRHRSGRTGEGCCRTCLPGSRRKGRSPPPTAPMTRAPSRPSVQRRFVGQKVPGLFAALLAAAPPERQALDAGHSGDPGAQRDLAGVEALGPGAVAELERVSPPELGGDMSRLGKGSGVPFPRRLDEFHEAARAAADVRSASTLHQWRRVASPSAARLPKSRSAHSRLRSDQWRLPLVPAPLHGPRPPITVALG